MTIENKVAIVTGAAQGIGQAIAQHFATCGAKVLLSDINEAGGAAAAEALSGRSDNVAFQACDVGDKAQADALIARAVSEFGAVDILINNAGIIHTADFLDLAEEDFDRVLRVNLKGALLCSQAAARWMVENNRPGAIVNMSSVNAILTIPNQIPYNVSKGGINQLTRVMSLALAPHNIRVNAIGPGTIATDMAKVVMEDDAARQRLMSRTPLGRLGEPSEVATIAEFLASDASSYVTGQILYCDGGRLPLNYTVPVED